MQSYLPKLGVSEASIPVVEEAYEDLLDLMNEHLRQHPFLMGGRPCLADYAMMGPLYAHLARDVYPSSHMKKRAPFVYRWVERMNAGDDGMAEFFDWDKELPADDALPDTLLPILSYFVNDYAPELVAVIEIVNARAREDGVEPGSPVLAEGARGIGERQVAYRGLTLDLGMRHFTFYMLQRPILYFQSLTGSEKKSASGLIESIGATDLLGLKLERKMARVDGVEIFE